MGMRLDSQKLAISRRREGLVRGLGWFSLGFGILELLAPRSLCRAIGVSPRKGLVQTLGLREITSGIGILTRADKGSWIRTRVAGDCSNGFKRGRSIRAS